MRKTATSRQPSASGKKARGFKTGPCVTIAKQTAAKLHTAAAAAAAENVRLKASLQETADVGARLVEHLRHVIAMLDRERLHPRACSCPNDKYNDLDEKKLEAARALTARELEELAMELDRTVKAIKSRAKILGVRRLNAHRPYTKKEDSHLRKLFPDHTAPEIASALRISRSRVERRARLLRLKKSPTHLAKLKRIEIERLLSSGAGCRFPRGHVPANKGLRRPGYSKGRGRMAETCFQKGQRPRNVLPVGTVKANADGYLRVKISDRSDNGRGANDRNWEFVHRRVWEAAHGPIPKGHRIWWKDKNHANCALENLELLSDKEHMARTTIHNLPGELKETILLAGRLKRRIGTVERGKERHQGVAQASI